MTNKILLHPTFNHAQDITDLCRPLGRLDISYFAHVHIDNNQNFSGICNNPGFLDQYLTNGYYNADIHMAKNKKLGNYIVWDALELGGMTKKMDSAASHFGIRHAFTIIEKNRTGDHFYHFANNSSSKEINQVYLANIDLLKMFIDYFNENISQSAALHSAYDLKFEIDPQSGNYITKNDLELLTTAMKNRVNFIQEISANANNILQYEPLSRRELDCMKYVVNGKTAREVAAILGLSKRTVEFYISNIKSKLHVTSKSQLIETFTRLFN